MVIGVGIHKMPVRIANREGSDQTASDLDLGCLSRPLLQATRVQDLRTFTRSTKVLYAGP